MSSFNVLDSDQQELQDLQAPATWQAGFERIQGRLYQICAKSFRSFPPADRDIDEAVQEAVCVAMFDYKSLFERGECGRATVATIAKYAMIAVRRMRRISSCNGQRGKGRADAFDKMARTELMDVSASGRNRRREYDPHFRIEFGDWFDSLNERNKAIAYCFVRGDSANDIADRFNISTARVSQIRQELRTSWMARA